MLPACTVLSIMKTIKSREPSPSKSATAMLPPWFSQLNQSGMSIQGVQPTS